MDNEFILGLIFFFFSVKGFYHSCQWFLDRYGTDKEKMENIGRHGDDRE